MFKGLWNRVWGVEPPEPKQKPKPQTPDEAAEAFHQSLNHIIERYINEQESGEKTLRGAIDDLIPSIDKAYVDYLRASEVPDEAIRHKLERQVIWSMLYPPSGTYVWG